MTSQPTAWGILGEAIRQPGPRWIGLFAGVAYLLVYLVSLGQIVVGARIVAGGPGIHFLPDWPAKVLKPIGGFTFEPVGALALPGVTILLSIPNLVIGFGLGTLIALNLATGLSALTTIRTCRRLPWTGLLGSLPGLLTGFACCVPTVALVLGANLTLAFIGLQGFLLPISVAALAAGLVWNLRRTREEILRAAGDQTP